MATDAAAGRLLTGAAWGDFCETLKVAGRMIDHFGDQPSDLDRAEWYRFLTRLTRSGLERLVENGEPTRPRLRDMVWRQSINFQTVDQDHLMCQFDEARDYVITGTRGTIPYFILAVLSAPAPAEPGAQDWAPLGLDGLPTFDPSNLKTTGFLASQQLTIAEDGTFEIIVSQNDPGPGKNWLPLRPDTNCMLVRYVWSDRATQIAPTLTIARADGAAPEPLTPALMANNLAWAGQNVLGYAELPSWYATGGRATRATFRPSLTASISAGRSTCPTAALPVATSRSAAGRKPSTKRSSSNSRPRRASTGTFRSATCGRRTSTPSKTATAGSTTAASSQSPTAVCGSSSPSIPSPACRATGSTASAMTRASGPCASCRRK